MERVIDKIAEVELKTDFDMWSCIITVVIIIGILWFLRWAFQEFFQK
jgi:hypothetical protein